MKYDFMKRIASELTNTFEQVYGWFQLEQDKLYASPNGGGWSIAEILEHISITNYFLIKLIRKGALRSLEMSRGMDYQHLLTDYDLDWEKLELIGKHGAFKWERPAHMVPTGNADLEKVKQTLTLQEKECLDWLDDLQDGQGVLYKTTMTVNQLGKIDVYHYIYFLVQHARRHLTQMENTQKG